MAVHHLPVVDWRVQQESVPAVRNITPHSCNIAPETPRHLLPENHARQHQVRRQRKDYTNWRIYVWQQTQIQSWANFSRHVGLRDGWKGQWQGSHLPCAEPTKRNPGNRTDTAVRGTWNHDHLWQVFTILQPEPRWVRPPHGEPFRELCGSIHRCPHEYHRGTLESGEEETEGDEWDSTKPASRILRWV